MQGGIGNQLLQYALGEYIKDNYSKNIFYLDISQSFKNINKLYFLHISKTMFRIQYILYPLLKFRFEKLEFDYSEIKTDGNFSAMDIIYNDLPYLQLKI